ncbi:MAG: hypothetical protein U1F66_01655 [bacterium]
MTPPGNGGRRAPHLTLVPSGGSPATPDPLAPEPRRPSTPPPNGDGRASLPSLPPRSADLGGLRAIIEGTAPTLSNFQHLSNFLAELANPTETGGYNVRFKNLNYFYNIVQENPGEAIRVTITEERPARSGSGIESREILQLHYLADGQISSSVHSTPHAEPERGPEFSYHNILRTFLGERAQRLINGEDLFTRLDTSLRALRGRATPESQSVWYDNFVAHEGKVYSFRRLDLMGLSELIASPQLNQIAIFEETGGEKVRVATLSANGEVEFNPERATREPLTHDQLALLEGLEPLLDAARSDPAAYQRRLRASLAKLPNFKNITPTIEPSLAVSRTLTMGSGSHGYLAEYRNGWDLLSNLFTSQRWQNPQDPNQVRNLRAPWRLRRTMTWELLRWAGSTARYVLSENIRNPRVATDSLRLMLHPEGGGQLTIYRGGALHDILIAGGNGSLWRADQEIRQMQREGMSFPTRMDALRAAVARHNPNSSLPIALHVQEAPTFDLNRFHLDASGAPVPVRTAGEAWRLLRSQISSNVEPRVEFQLNGSVFSPLISTSSEPNRILVDFRESQPSLTLDINHQNIRVGETEVPRVQITMVRGEDVYARVFENGVIRPDLAPDVLHSRLTQARQGAVYRSLATRLGQGALRLYAHSAFSGRVYGGSYFLSLPIISLLERGIFNEHERRLIGSPGLNVSMQWDSVKRNVIAPFLFMAGPSSASTLLTDGLFNSLPGLRRSLVTWQSTETSLLQALRMHRPSFYNPSPAMRPVGPNFFFRGFLQRAVPLFVGITAIDRYQHGQWFSPRFLTNLRDVALVSAGSAGLMRMVYSSERLSSALVRRSLLTDAVVGSGGARFGLTLRGGILLATLEMAALGVLNAYERRAALRESGTALRSELGRAIDRRNELVTRLESGEEIAPRYLVSADAEVHNAQAAYRRFLEMTDQTSGTGSYAAIGSANDFEEEMQRYDRDRALAASSPGDPLAATRAESEHLSRLRTLRGRYERMEGELDRLYERFGASGSNTGAGPSLRDFLRNAAASTSESETAPPSEPVRSPIPINSADAQAILEQLRWKAAQDPASILWSREQRAAYIMREFRGYRVTDSDGTRRPWNQAETFAFLDAVDQANLQRVHNLEAPLTAPQPGEGFDTTRLQELVTAERGIRDREAADHRYAAVHSAALAGNVADLDRQMADYYRTTNARVATALSRFMDGPTLAMADLPATGSAMP